jgi:hypothetical protein
VTESPSNTILRIDPSSNNAKTDETILDLPLPDNLTPNGDSFLATQFGSAFLCVAFRNSKSLFSGTYCDLDFSVVEVNSQADVSSIIYSAIVDWQVTQALVKDNVMHIGNYETGRILRVEGF